jgi:ATP-dependent Clp protease ATP-binding subunit ClpC
MPGLYPNAPEAADVAFTDDTRGVLAGARGEADRLRHEYIGTEHVLLALTQEGQGAAALRRFGLDPEQVRVSLEGIVGSGRATLQSLAERPYTSRTRQAFGLAVECAATAGHAMVDVEHLVVGLLRERLNVGAQVLLQCGLTVEHAERVARQRSAGQSDAQ